MYPLLEVRTISEAEISAAIPFRNTPITRNTVQVIDVLTANSVYKQFGYRILKDSGNDVDQETVNHGSIPQGDRTADSGRHILSLNASVIERQRHVEPDHTLGAFAGTSLSLPQQAAIDKQGSKPHVGDDDDSTAETFESFDRRNNMWYGFELAVPVTKLSQTWSRGVDWLKTLRKAVKREHNSDVVELGKAVKGLQQVFDRDSKAVKDVYITCHSAHPDTFTRSVEDNRRCFYNLRIS